MGWGEQGKKAAVGRREQELQKQDSKKGTHMVLKTNSLVDNLEKCTRLVIFILIPRDFVQRSFPSSYSYRRSLRLLKRFRPCLPCPIPPSGNIFLSRTYPLNLHFLPPWHLHCKNKLFIYMKTAPLFPHSFMKSVSWQIFLMNIWILLIKLSPAFGLCPGTQSVSPQVHPTHA